MTIKDNLKNNNYMKGLLSLTLISALFVLSSCSKEYTCECITIIGGITTQTTIEASSKAKAKSECDESDTELLGVPVVDCELI